VPKYQFLTDEWVAEAKRIRESIEGELPKPAHEVRMNLVITAVPFGEGTLQAHMDTSDGEMRMDLHHVEDPQLTVTVDYDTAKAIFVDGNPQAGMQAFMAGKVKVEGDMTKLMAMQTATPDPLAAKVSEAIKDMTAE
jgi:putative sterol carrier protein